MSYCFFCVQVKFEGSSSSQAKLFPSTLTTWQDLIHLELVQRSFLQQFLDAIIKKN